MGVQIYEEGHKAANKSTGSGIYATSERKLDFAWKPVDGNTDISHLYQLIGLEFNILVPVDTHDIIKKCRIIETYPHCVKAVYTVGREDGDKHELCTCLSTAELVEKGIISFATGHPEVIKKYGETN